MDNTDVSLLSLNSGVVDLVHEEVHKMRSSIEIKWAVAEHEIDRILGLMGLKSKGSLFRDLALLCDNVLKRRPDMSQMTVRMRKTFDIARPKRNALVHGRLFAPPTKTHLHIEKTSESVRGGFHPLISGPLTMTHKGTNVELTVESMKMVQDDVDRFLDSIRDVVISLEYDYMDIELHLEVSSDADVHFGSGERKIVKRKRVRFSEIFQ